MSFYPTIITHTLIDFEHLRKIFSSGCLFFTDNRYCHKTVFIKYLKTASKIKPCANKHIPKQAFVFSAIIMKEEVFS